MPSTSLAAMVGLNSNLCASVPSTIGTQLSEHIGTGNQEFGYLKVIDNSTIVGF